MRFLFLLLAVFIVSGCDDEPKAADNVNKSTKQQASVSSDKVDVEFQPLEEKATFTRKTDACITSYRVKITDQILMLPKSNLYLKKNKVRVPQKNGKLHYPCEQKFDDYIEVDYIYFRPRKVDHYGGKGGEIGYRWVLEVTITPSELEAGGGYKSLTKSGYLPPDLNLSELPTLDDFYLYKGDTILLNTDFILISKDKSFLDNYGDPVTFYCSPDVATNSDGTKCGASVYTKGGIRYSFSNLHSNWVPVSELKNFYKTFSKYMNNFDVTDEYNQQIQNQ